MADATRGERIAEFLRRLAAAPAASDHDEAFRLVADIFNEVEDAMTSIPFDPSYPMTGERMYPPRLDNRRSVPGRPDVVRYRSRRHSTLIGDNGAIRVVESSSRVVILDKPGTDGRTI